MPYYPKRKSYKKKRRYGRKSRKSKRKPMLKRYKRKSKSGDNGTFLKISSSSCPVVINNAAAAVAPFTNLSADTFQSEISFRIGDTTSGETIQLDNQTRPLTNDEIRVQENILYLGSSDLLAKYRGLYKYMQVFKIVVKFTPTVTDGGVLAQTDAFFANGLSGTVMTDYAITEDPSFNYWQNYPPSIDGQAKAQSRKVARTHKIYKGWTRTFTPRLLLTSPNANPKSKYQYKPEFDLETDDAANYEPLDNGSMVIRMRKPQLAGQVVDSLDATEEEYPSLAKWVRFGTLTAHAYIKFRSPFY